MRQVIRGGLLMTLLLIWAGAALAAGSAERASVPLSRVCAHHVCTDPAAVAGIRLADTPTQADHLWTRCRGGLTLGGSADKRPPLDFAEERLIYIHMGARRTGGFRLEMAGETADLVDNTLVIPLIWGEPSKDAIVTQMLTHPCVLLSVPRGGYERIDVVDEQGRTRLSHTLPAQTP